MQRHEDSHQKLKQWSEKGHLFALIDSHFEKPPGARVVNLEFRDTDPLFFEVIAWDRVKYLSPQLIEVTPATLEWLSIEMATERWGLFLACEDTLERLAGHLQKFVIARGPDRNPYFLRFHDPSVLETLLFTWSEHEKRTFTAPLAAIGYPDLDSLGVRLWINRARATWPLPEDCLLDLRAEQLAKAAETISRDLVKIIYWYLRNHHAKAVQYLAPAELLVRVDVGLARARKYKLISVADLAGFVALMFELAPNFDEHPRFQDALSSTETPPESKIRHLSKTITDRDWREAQARFDRRFWTKRTG
jgi:hypothetical protein